VNEWGIIIATLLLITVETAMIMRLQKEQIWLSEMKGKGITASNALEKKAQNT
jgi:hypothetical protein